MRKMILVFALLNALNLCTIAQKHDYQWLFGYENASAATDTNFGGVTLDFNYTSPKVLKHVRLADFDGCNVSFCDNNGNLLFYSNGGDIFDQRDSVMDGGDSINFGKDWINYKTMGGGQRYSGLPTIQGMLALPSDDSSQVYLMHYIIDEIDFSGGGVGYLADTSCFTKIDLKANVNLGSVTSKNNILTTDTLAYGMFSAVRHGNGKDWWVLHPRYLGNCYYTFLLSDTGPGLNNIQCIGQPQIYYGGLGTSCFSPNGENYFWVSPGDGIHMFDFDRCTGLLSNPQIISFPIPHFADSVFLCSGIAVSPSNRYLYILANTLALQYDLQASNISASVDTVARWAYDPIYPYATTFFWAQIGPDGRIYINSPNGVKSLSVIDRPDQAGDSCRFLQHSVHLNTYNEASLPNFPNYRLGAWAGSACDTLSTASEEVRATKEKIVKVFPNPTNEMVTIDYGFTDWNKGEIRLEIVNELGQIVYAQKLPMYSGYQKLDVSNFASGFYQVYIKRGVGIVAMSKLVKE
ncbi:MAG: hypothetical protein JWO06_3317 [Bacteroidota bacterium]|nr:hypothetical protein [Bacteroidota bacterium]